MARSRASQRSQPSPTTCRRTLATPATLATLPFPPALAARVHPFASVCLAGWLGPSIDMAAPCVARHSQREGLLDAVICIGFPCTGVRLDPRQLAHPLTTKWRQPVKACAFFCVCTVPFVSLHSSQFPAEESFSFFFALSFLCPIFIFFFLVEQRAFLRQVPGKFCTWTSVWRKPSLARPCTPARVGIQAPPRSAASDFWYAVEGLCWPSATARSARPSARVLMWADTTSARDQPNFERG